MNQPSPTDSLVSDEIARLDTIDAEARVRWAVERFGEGVILSSSFGAQSAVCLHLASQVKPDIPVVLIDTGYLFKETYDFADQLTERLSLNLKVYRPKTSAAWQEARFGKLWEQGIEGIEKYNTMNKVEPMQRALDELNVTAWISGVRRDQASTRTNLRVVVQKHGAYKIHPIIDWSDKDIFDYLKKHDLPYHPLWEQGYISLGDWHTSHKLTDGMNPDDARFHGLKRECGLHEDTEVVDYII